MLNLFTLQFKDSGIEDNYIKSSRDKILMEFSTFAMLIIVRYIILCFKVYCILQAISFFSRGSFSAGFTYTCGIIITAASYKLIQQKPTRFNIILVAFQLVVTLSFNLKCLEIFPEAQPSKFQWFQGYQCAFLHFCIYLQGSQYLLQSLALFIVFPIHLMNYVSLELESILNLVIYYWIFFSMLSIRYVFELEKRTTYTYQREQNKINLLMEKALEQWMLTVKIDEKSQLLELVSCNIYLKEAQNIKTDMDMRNFLRLVLIKHEKNGFKNHLETHITQLYQSRFKNSKQDNEIGFHKHKAMCKLSKRRLVVRIMRLYQDNQLMFLVLLDQCYEHRQIRGLQKKIDLFGNILNDIQQNLKPVLCRMIKNITSVPKYCLPEGGSGKINSYLALNQIMNLELICSPLLSKQLETVHLSKILTYLQNIFGGFISIEAYSDIEIHGNFNLIMQMKISIIDFFIDFCRGIKKPIILLSTVVESCIDFKLQFYSDSIVEEELKKILLKNQISHRTRSITNQFKGQVQSIMSHLLILSKNFEGTKIKSQTLNMLKLATSNYLLAQLGPSGNFKVNLDKQKKWITVSYRVLVNVEPEVEIKVIKSPRKKGPPLLGSEKIPLISARGNETTIQ